MSMSVRGRRVAATLCAALATMAVTATQAYAHAAISPPVAQSNELQLYSLAVPTEEDNATTTTVTLTVPNGFGIDSFDAAPGWKRNVQATGSGEEAVVQKVTWTGGKVPTGEDSVFRFLGDATKAGDYTFKVEQTYSNGKVVDWSGSESSDTPAPIVKGVSDLGSGGGSNTWGIIGLIVGAIALLLAAVALFGRGRELT